MVTSCFGIRAILALFLIHMTRDTICETAMKISTEKTIETNETLLKGKLEKSDSTCHGPRCLKYWMSVMGTVQKDLLNVQAIIVKDLEIEGNCSPTRRESNKRFLMCAGSILNRNHVLTSASCMHKATHIRHNVRGTLAVVIAPLKSSIQVIRVTAYKIHPRHTTNPYAFKHLKHNLAILKLACRIDMEHFQKIELPQAPFMHTCSEENCIVAVYRRVRRLNWVMYQILAPNVPLPTRRRKETTIKDGELRKILEYKNSKIPDDRIYRSKRRLAEPRIFIGRYESRKKIEIDNDELTKNGIVENSLIEQTTMIFGDIENSSLVTSTSLQNVLYENWSRPIGNQKIKSFVVRSSDGLRSCAQTGAAVMINRTQAAVVSASCDDRQSTVKWGYTDLFDNVNWIREILQDWGTNTSSSSSSPEVPNGHGNSSSCGTCIFNFFIEIGCKDKNSCGNKSTTNSRPKHSMSEPRKYSDSIEGTKSKSCSATNSLGIEIGMGQGCEKGNEKNDGKPEYRENWAKSSNQRNSGVVKQKHASLSSEQFDEISKLARPISIDPMKKIIVKDQRGDGNKYTRKDDSQFVSSSDRRILERPLSISRIYETSKNQNKNHERANNEIGTRNNDGGSTDWLSEVEKRLEISSDVKRELPQPRRSP